LSIIVELFACVEVVSGGVVVSIVVIVFFGVIVVSAVVVVTHSLTSRNTYLLLIDRFSLNVWTQLCYHGNMATLWQISVTPLNCPPSKTHCLVQDSPLYLL